MPTVLLVEDNRLARATNQHLLSKAGFDVLVAEDGEKALHVARTASPDVILLDILLPRVSGEIVLQALKQDSQTSDIPVIILSSLWQKNEQRLIEDGAIAFLEKTKVLDDPQLLVKIIETVLDRAGYSSTPSLNAAG